MTDILTPENAQKYACEICDFKCCKQSDWHRHIATRKHERLTNTYENTDAISTPKNTLHFCECGNTYKHRQSLFTHKKKCQVINNTTTSQVHLTEDPSKLNPDLLVMLMQQNKDMQTMMMEVIKNGTHNTNTNTNTTTNSHNNNNNKTFNLQIFLNETCKDAMNLMDFVQDIVLTLNDLEETGRIGFAEGISNMINKRLKALEVTQRPIHCSDLKRETLYIKNENRWEKEDDAKPMLTNAVKHIAGKNMMQIFDWQKAHPDYNDPETRTSDKYMKMLTNVMSGGTEEEIQENYEKIVKNIIKETAIVKENFLI
jgi:hypothetical protein